MELSNTFMTLFVVLSVLGPIVMGALVLYTVAIRQGKKRRHKAAR